MQRVEANVGAAVEEEKKQIVETQAQVQSQVKQAVQQEASPDAKAAASAIGSEVARSAGPSATQAIGGRPESPGGSQRSAGKQRSSRGSGSSKKVVKKRIVKMMKQGKLVAEKEEILDEEGNVIRTEIRKEGLSSGSPSRSQS